MVEGLVAAGKHVLCEKPLSDNLQDARAMADLARSANTVVRIGFTFRRAPGDSCALVAASRATTCC